jgi:cytochrome c
MTTRTTTIVLLTGAALLLAGSAPRAEDGAAVYKEQCAKCHGDTGESDTGTGKTLKIPPLKGDARIAAMPAADVAKAVTGNEKHKSILKKLTDAQIEAAAAHTKTIAAGK